jgi:hypothetical protein
MKSCQHRVFELVASTVTVAALAVPVTAAAGSGRSLGTSSPEYSNRILRNDIAHYGTQLGPSAPRTSPVQRQSPAAIVVRVDGGFDWTAAGVGAAGGIGLALVAGAATSALHGRRRIEVARLERALRKGV